MKNADIRNLIDEDASLLDRRMVEGLSHPAKQKADPFRQPHPAEAENATRFHAWSDTKGRRGLERLYKLLSALVCFGIIAVFLICAPDLPSFGGAETFMDNEVSVFYTEEGVRHTNAQNIVTGIILDFRGFDTLGESHVLFIALCTVMMLLRLPDDAAVEDREWLAEESEPEDPILSMGAKVLAPLILVFGIYILLNGQLSPGGGFSGGAILGAGFILYITAFGFKKAERFFTMKSFRVVSTCALVFYACSKGYVFVTGANHIKNGISTGTFGSIFSGGLLMPLSFAVGMVVCCTMVALYALFRKGDL